jgi:hypothetical protein
MKSNINIAMKNNINIYINDGMKGRRAREDCALMCLRSQLRKLVKFGEDRAKEVESDCNSV